MLAQAGRTVQGDELMPDEVRYHRRNLQDEDSKLVRALRYQAQRLNTKSLAGRSKTVEDVQAVVNRMAEDIENEIRRIQDEKRGKR